MNMCTISYFSENLPIGSDSQKILPGHLARPAKGLILEEFERLSDAKALGNWGFAAELTGRRPRKGEQVGSERR